MTDMDLEYGCDIEQTVCYRSAISNALFERAGRWPLENAHPAVVEKDLHRLINVGYDKEERSEEVLTILLHTPISNQPQVIKCLKALIKRGATPHATNVIGRSVLHRALAALGVVEKCMADRLKSHDDDEDLHDYEWPLGHLDIQ